MFATLVGPYPRRRHSPEAGAGAQAAEQMLTREVMAEQVESGMGLLTDGLPARILSEPTWRAPVFLSEWQFANEVARELAADSGGEPGRAPLPVKQCLVGPYSLARMSAPGEADRERLTLAFAEVLNQELRALAKADVPVIQIDEDAFATIAEHDAGERCLAAEALRRLTDGLDAAHLSLAVSGGSADRAGAALFYDAPFSSYLFDLIAGPDNWRLLAHAPGDRGIIAGVADARTPRPDHEAVMVWAARYAAALNRRGLDRVGLAPSAGLESLTREQARVKLAGLAAAGRKAAITDAHELRSALDPRAVDARTAALGRYSRGRSSPRES
ncbi:MAG: hypothetical protein H0V12_10550 [Chloroflexi bacterium]|nr:hypothetical protein [Chloroflexota bacterium]